MPSEHVETLWTGPLGTVYVDYVLATEDEAEALAGGGLDACRGGGWSPLVRFPLLGVALFVRVRGGLVGRGDGAAVSLPEHPPGGV